jgi:predicted nucleic acid-binding protein
MLVVADSSALVALATCSALDVLARLYDEVRVPQAVYDEVVVPERPQAAVLSSFLAGRVVKVDMARWIVASGGLGQGELEAMALYKQLAADALLIDDRRARAVAEYNRIVCIGALGILLLAKHQGVIQQVAPYVERLRNSPLHYGEPLLARVLSLAGESM